VVGITLPSHAAEAGTQATPINDYDNPRSHPHGLPEEIIWLFDDQRRGEQFWPADAPELAYSSGAYFLMAP